MFVCVICAFVQKKGSLQIDDCSAGCVVQKKEACTLLIPCRLCCTCVAVGYWSVPPHCWNKVCPFQCSPLPWICLWEVDGMACWVIDLAKLDCHSKGVTCNCKKMQQVGKMTFRHFWSWTLCLFNICPKFKVGNLCARERERERERAKPA